MANPKTNANRQSTLRDRKRLEGLKPVLVWLPTGDTHQLQRVKRLRGLSNIDGAVSALCELASAMTDAELATSHKKRGI